MEYFRLSQSSINRIQILDVHGDVTERLNLLLRIPTQVGLVREVEQRVLRAILELAPVEDMPTSARVTRSSWIP